MYNIIFQQRRSRYILLPQDSSHEDEITLAKKEKHFISQSETFKYKFKLVDLKRRHQILDEKLPIKLVKNVHLINDYFSLFILQ